MCNLKTQTKKYFRMKYRKLLIIFLIILITGYVIYLSFSISRIPDFKDTQEITEIVNPTNGEKIFLIKTSWGFGDSRMAIGLDKELKGGFSNEYKDKYESIDMGGYPILYKLDNDTLNIYDGYFKKPEIDKFKTVIILHELDVIERQFYSKNYVKLGLMIFPESQKYLVLNRAR
jgi:hypothetical protein